jgi:hypothetical protein
MAREDDPPHLKPSPVKALALLGEEGSYTPYNQLYKKHEK